MIKIFPLLIDSTIPQNIIPGICKVLERYIIVYKLNTLIAMGGSMGQHVGQRVKTGVSNSIDGFLKSKGLHLDSADVYDGSPILSENDPDLKNKVNDAKERNRWGRELETYRREKRRQEEFDKSQKERNAIEKKKATRELSNMRIDEHVIRSNLSLEPTWITFESTAGTMLVGIKVIPVPITNPDVFIAQLMDDKSISTFERMVLSLGNTIIRTFRNVMRTYLRKPLRIFGITFPEIKGDPFDDIILGKSKFGQDVMLLLNYANIKDDEIFMDAGGLDKLFALGWSSILVADDVAKKVIFCMREFYGHCSFVPYSFVYQAIGKDAMSAYQDLETAKKNMSPFYQQKADASKFFGESVAKELLERYSSLKLPCTNGDCD